MTCQNLQKLNPLALDKRAGRLKPDKRDSMCAPLARPMRALRQERLMANPMKFVQQTRAEIAKVVWPTRRETMLTTAMVFLMATILAIFFSLIDILIRYGLEAILSLAS